MGRFFRGIQILLFIVVQQRFIVQIVRICQGGHWAGEPSGPEGGKAGDTIAVVIISGLPVYLLLWRGTAMVKQRHYKWQR